MRPHRHPQLYAFLAGVLLGAGAVLAGVVAGFVVKLNGG